MKIDFNRGWYFQNKEGKKIPVNLPHDAMIHEERDRRTNNGNRSGYYPGGSYQYTKEFTLSAAPATDEGFTARSHRTYYGRVQAVFKAGYEAGDTEIKICAGAHGIEVTKRLTCTENKESEGKLL